MFIILIVFCADQQRELIRGMFDLFKGQEGEDKTIDDTKLADFFMDNKDELYNTLRRARTQFTYAQVKYTKIYNIY